MTKPHHPLFLLLPLVFITWWTLTFGFKTSTPHTTYTKPTGANINANSMDLTVDGHLGNSGMPCPSVPMDNASKKYFIFIQLFVY